MRKKNTMLKSLNFCRGRMSIIPKRTEMMEGLFNIPNDGTISYLHDNNVCFTLEIIIIIIINDNK